jgi:methionine--tRNA ligase beta chain
MAGETSRKSTRTSAQKELRLGTPEVIRAAKITAAVVGVLALTIGLWYARTAILLAFGGILLAIVLYGASRALAELTELPRMLMLAAVVVVTAAFFGLVIVAAGPTLAVQIAQLARGIAAGATTLTKEVASFADQATTAVDSGDAVAAEPLAGECTIDDFSKVDLRVARVLEVEEVPEARKLLKLTLGLGGDVKRTVFAGIKAAYDPQSLEGRLVVMVANLKPRQMKFGLSEGMVLAAGPGDQEVFVLSPDTGAQPGQRVH